MNEWLLVAKDAATAATVGAAKDAAKAKAKEEAMKEMAKVVPGLTGCQGFCAKFDDGKRVSFVKTMLLMIIIPSFPPLSDLFVFFFNAFTSATQHRFCVCLYYTAV